VPASPMRPFFNPCCSRLMHHLKYLHASYR
jgi:hypothetical protein